MIDKLDWSRFDWDSFQKLCNDLLAQELRSPQFIPYAPGGTEPFDAVFEGAYGDMSGRWGFDAKFRSPQPGKKNVQSLQREIVGSKREKGLLTKGEDERRDFVVLLTNVRLRGPDQTKLVGLANGRSVHLFIWDEERLRTLLVAYPYVRFYHFNGPGFPMFIPYRQHFAAELNPNLDRFISHIAPLYGQEQAVAIYRTFMAGAQRILPIYAPPGMGKSRFLLECARITEEAGWLPLFLQPEGKVLEDHLTELCPNHKYVVFLDDSQRHTTKFSEILALLRAEGYYAGLKFVLASRLALQDQVASELAYRDPGELAEPMLLSPLDRTALERLLGWQLPEAPISTIEARRDTMLVR